ncbi:MAG: ribonuclease D [Saprospiraceae bacterium]
MFTKHSNFTLIESQKDLDLFYRQNQGIEWLCFDTEFVGEKRYVTSLCLLQAATVHGNYLIDPFVVEDLSPFLEFIENERIVKVTHAGDNDYRLLNTLYDTIPKNIFDTQIAAAFAGYRYPVSFRKLVEVELRISLNKSYAVTDWEARPFTPKQLDYALEDVLPLHDLWGILAEKLERNHRLDWAVEEFRRMESPDYYTKDPNQEALSSDLMKSLNKREQIFLLRLLDWRRRTAEEKNYSKEMILPGKLISQIVRGMSAGRDALLRNRRLPEKLIRQYIELFERFYKEPATETEKKILQQLPAEENEDPYEEMLQETLYLLVKYKCLENGVSPTLALPRAAIKKVRNGDAGLMQSLENGWRKQLFGDALVERILNFDKLDMKVSETTIELLIGE